MVTENLVSHFTSRAYNSIDDLSETIMNPAKCRYSTVKHSIKYNIYFVHPVPVNVYTDIIKQNLVGDSYVRILTSLHFPSAKGYHRFDYPFTNQWNNPM